MTRKSDAAVAIKPDASLQPTPLGNPMWGSPFGTGPSVETPSELRSKIQLTAIVPMTATSPPGIALIQRPKTISVASTATETPSVHHDTWPSSVRVSQNLISVPLAWSSETLGDGTPSIPPT